MNSYLGVLCAILGLAAVTPQMPAASVDYFPLGTFSLNFSPDEAKTKSDEMRRNEFSAELRVMDEPSLFEVSQKKDLEVYRFLWLRSFHQPCLVRLTVNADGSGELVVKVMSGRSGHDNEHLIIDEKTHLLPAQVRSFDEKLIKANFWTLPTTRLEDIYGRDGAIWLLEGTKNRTYHAVDRWSPHGGPYRDACLYLAFDLARLKIPEREIY